MKKLIFILLLPSTLYFAQETPLKKLPEFKIDSTKILKFDKDLFKKFYQDNSVNNNDKIDYKILVKKPEHPELYSMLVLKPKKEEVPIPNAVELEKVPKVMDPKSLKELNIIK